MTTGGVPIRLSLVIVASDSLEAAIRTLASASPLPEGMEALIVGSLDLTGARLSARARWIQGPAGVSVARLRRIGLDASLGGLVVFTEDSCILPNGYLLDWERNVPWDDAESAGGAVEPFLGDDRVDWGVFYAEYAPFLPGGPRRQPRLAGNNFALKRDRAGRLDNAEIHETDVSRVLATKRGLAGPSLFHVRSYSVHEALRDRLRFGFDYGRRRCGRHSALARWGACCVGPLIFAVQAQRLLRTINSRPRYAGPLLEALPATLGLLLAWSVGEWLGWMSSLLLPPASGPRHGTKDRPGARDAGRPVSEPAR